MKTRTNGLQWGCLVIASLLFACGNEENEGSPTGNRLRLTVDSLKRTDFFTARELRPRQQQELEGFYQGRHHELAWNRADSLLPRVDSLIVALRDAEAEGLEPETYQLSELEALQERARRDSARHREEALVQLDLLATTQYLKYASHLLSGRIDPHALDTNWIAHPREKDLTEHLHKALESNEIRKSLLELLPANRQYALLKEKLARYRAFTKAGGQEVGAPSSRKGSLAAAAGFGTGAANNGLRERLALYGLLDTTGAASAGIGSIDSLGIALKQFQQLHGLDTTGMVDDSTRAALNRPPEEVIETIKINLERLRWMPESYGDKYLVVNLPESRLKVYENESEVLGMRVIVGDEYAATPVFTDTIEYITFSPDWTIPLTIAGTEILPALQRNPNYLKERNMVLYDSWDTVNARQLNPREINWSDVTAKDFKYRVVQQPGRDNPMGRMKFMLPNPEFIYLHDTPADHLFASEDRAVSHGCIRVEKPEELANYLLAANPNWSSDKLSRYTNLKDPRRVDLQRTVPIAITYQTAWVDEANRLHLRKDIYGFDQKQMQAITQQEQLLSSK